MASGVCYGVPPSPWAASAETQDMCYHFFMLFYVCINIDPIYMDLHASSFVFSMPT